MKQCPRCRRNYDDDQLNFCLDDGELLTLMSAPQTRYDDDAPPTLLLDQSRVTNPASWPASPPPGPVGQWQAPGVPFHQAGQYAMPTPMTRNQTLAAASLMLGIASVTVGWCCSTGMLLSPAALITGFIALSQMKKDPARFSGRGLAIGGIVTGIIYICVLLFVLLIWGISLIGSGLGSIN